MPDESPLTSSLGPINVSVRPESAELISSHKSHLFRIYFNNVSPSPRFPKWRICLMNYDQLSAYISQLSLEDTCRTYPSLSLHLITIMCGAQQPSSYTLDRKLGESRAIWKRWWRYPFHCQSFIPYLSHYRLCHVSSSDSNLSNMITENRQDGQAQNLISQLTGVVVRCRNGENASWEVEPSRCFSYRRESINSIFHFLNIQEDKKRALF